jgi:23S rRNA pseudouridine2605 synthase
LVEGSFVKPIRVEKVRRGTIKIVIGEGKKREVRMLLDAAGLKTKELTRIRLGGLHLGALPVGSWRPLTEKEKQLIFQK